jgi:hypothetical protein
MNKTDVIPTGKTLYHGTRFKLRTGMPIGINGSWFATDPKQSILHVAKKKPKNMYFYIYKTIRPLRVLKFESGRTMNNWALRSGFKLNLNKAREGVETNRTFAFSNKNRNLATHVCKEGKYDGWWFPNDQTQVMLCEPKNALKFVKVLEITFPYGRGHQQNIEFVRGNNKAEFVRVESAKRYKYKLSPRKLNNIENVPRNSVYSFKTTSGVLFFNHTGKRLNLNKNRLESIKGFTLNGKKYYHKGLNMLANNANYLHLLKKNIKSKNGINIPTTRVIRHPILTQAQANKNLSYYYRRLRAWQKAGEEGEPPKTPGNNSISPTYRKLPALRKNSNNNLNASNLYK